MPRKKFTEAQIWLYENWTMALRSPSCVGNWA